MRELLARLWADDTGAIITTEYVMVLGVVTMGGIAGANEVRKATVAGFQRLGRNIERAVPDPDQMARLMAQPVVRPATPAAVTAQPTYLFTPPAP